MARLWCLVWFFFMANAALAMDNNVAKPLPKKVKQVKANRLAPTIFPGSPLETSASLPRSWRMRSALLMQQTETSVSNALIDAAQLAAERRVDAIDLRDVLQRIVSDWLTDQAQNFAFTRAVIPPNVRLRLNVSRNRARIGFECHFR